VRQLTASKSARETALDGVKTRLGFQSGIQLQQVPEFLPQVLNQIFPRLPRFLDYSYARQSLVVLLLSTWVGIQGSPQCCKINLLVLPTGRRICAFAR
jgi:hypothetical protein